jgi:hypothetical protein
MMALLSMIARIALNAGYWLGKHKALLQLEVWMEYW